MLSELIKKKIEEKSEMKIRYSRDCEVLSAKIHQHCNTRLSPSTLRRLFGIVKGTGTVRAHTLDVIGNYIGYSSWDELIESFDEVSKKPKAITELKLSTLKKGAMLQYKCKPNIDVTIEVIGREKYRVINAQNSKLVVGDIFKAQIIKAHHPFFISDIIRGNAQIDKIVEGRISGVEAIKKL